MALTFNEMIDSPIRSIVGMSLKKLGISSRWLLPMSQFALGNHMLRNGTLNDMDALKTPNHSAGSSHLISLTLLETIERVSKNMRAEGSLRGLILDLAQSKESKAKISVALGKCPSNVRSDTILVNGTQLQKNTQLPNNTQCKPSRRFIKVDTLISHPIPNS